MLHPWRKMYPLLHPLKLLLFQQVEVQDGVQKQQHQGPQVLVEDVLQHQSTLVICWRRYELAEP